MSRDGWRELDPMGAGRRYAAGVCVDDRRFLVVGGRADFARDLSSCECYDAGADPPTWKPFPSMPSRRKQCGVASVGGKVYVMGGHGGTASGKMLGDLGWSGTKLLGDLISIDVSGGDLSALEGRSWETSSARMKQKRSAFACVSDSDSDPPCIYVFGGEGERGILDTAEKYDIGTDTWESLPRMPDKRWTCAAGKVGNKIYVVGGRDENYDTLSSTLVFDISSGRWDSVPDMKTERAGLSVAVVGDHVVAIGGDFDTIEILDTRQNSWVESRLRTNYSAFYSTAGFLSGRNEIIVAGANDSARSTSVPYEKVLS